MLRISEKCCDLGIETENKFSKLAQLIEELSQACAAAKGGYAARNQAAQSKREALEKRNKFLEDLKKQEDELCKLLKDQMEKDRLSFERVLESDSSLLTRTVASCFETAAASAGTIPVLIASVKFGAVAKGLGIVANAVSARKTPGTIKPKHGDTQQARKKKNDDWKEEYRLQAELTELERVTRELKTEAEIMAVPNKSANLKKRCALKEEVHEIMRSLKNYNGSQKTTLKELEKSSLELVDKLTNRNKEPSSAESDRKEIEYVALQMECANARIQAFFAHQAKRETFVRAPNRDRHAANSQGATEAHADNYRYKLEMAKLTLEGSRSSFIHANNCMREANQKMADNIEELAKIRIDEIDFDQIEDLLAKTFGALSEVEDQWRYLVQYFSKIATIIKTTMHENIKQFVENSGTLHEVLSGKNLSEKDRGKSQTVVENLSQMHRDIMFRNTSMANKSAYVVHQLASMYMDVSKNHIMGPVAKLGSLMALDPKKDFAAISAKQIQLKFDAQQACRNIKEIVIDRMGDYTGKITKRADQIDEELKKLPPRPTPHPKVEAARKEGIRESEKIHRREVDEENVHYEEGEDLSQNAEEYDENAASFRNTENYV